jgi:hypothetical protein
VLLAVLSYPKNFHITQVAVKHAKKHIPNISQVAIIWDNTHEINPSVPIYNYLGNAIMYEWSGLEHKISFTGNNWLEQQLIKLHADILLRQKEFILMDGDLVLNQDVDPKNILYASNIPRTHFNYNHVYELLGKGVYEFSTCPFMYVKSAWLKNIRELCIKNCHTDISTKMEQTFQQSLVTMHSHHLLDWNIIANYIIHVLKSPKKIEYFHRHSVKGSNFFENYNEDEYFVCDGPDNIDLQFYENEGIFIDKDLMSKLNY